MKWVNPDGSDPSEAYEITISPSDLTDEGLFFFKDPGSSDSPMAFSASWIKIEGKYYKHF